MELQRLGRVQIDRMCSIGDEVLKALLAVSWWRFSSRLLFWRISNSSVSLQRNLSNGVTISLSVLSLSSPLTAAMNDHKHAKLMCPGLRIQMPTCSELHFL
eukprot:TRINITY_DN6559_c0_g1_i2.p1 TRINITY_DN6559_c0_g1~~TRINITY_DN6559_c0_g1_i2.p1  ORF type:complete len:101 (+),score=10.51 TRINITY_DN6559_c0_g1_i2:223-525(+)